ncbi:MAG: glutamyl-tRNA synthetase [Candidatus Synechococcus spongiarum 15L]|uniref:Glutamate--tRNA ligase n=2 Tax=Candidatus Synechococcus spongiarum TaxID=431041 RepID=A0A1T1CRB7_9SYNE|nr:MAG: glutamyl-tRNA synthetase [Candidatus Synechococcus spongiarum 15L]OOV31149.1 glutamate--tRNA ligase [Candidatus Synechococcus spongiarum LMB bulk15M]
MSVRVRIAPSPTGNLHMGTARTAVFNWLFARRHGGRFLVRIEDTDRERSQPAFTDSILTGLRWLGLDWDEEPVFQSRRSRDHQEAIAALLANGRAYRCYATEAELNAMREARQAAHQAPRYDNRHRNLSPERIAAFHKEGRHAVVRFRIDDTQDILWQDMVRGPMRWQGADLGGDMVIARRAPADRIGDPLYNLAVVVDDIAMGITHVIRGEDHIANTAKQLLLYNALGAPPPCFAHTPLILNKEGRKLSKRDGVTSIADFQALGYTAAAVSNYMCLLGWSPPVELGERFGLADAAPVFGFDRVNKAGGRFDWDKLNWLNSQALHAMDGATLRNALLPRWQQAGLDTSQPLAWQEQLAALLGPSLVVLQDGVEQARPFLGPPELDDASRAQLQIEACQAALHYILQHRPRTFNAAAAKELLTAAARAAGVRKGVVMKGVRAALLGCLHGPDLLLSWDLLHGVGEDDPRLRAVLR